MDDNDLVTLAARSNRSLTRAGFLVYLELASREVRSC